MSQISRLKIPFSEEGFWHGVAQMAKGDISLGHEDIICLVCRGPFSSGERCPRCGLHVADNSPLAIFLFHLSRRL
ncbi:MAG: hypothetical protein ABIH38_04355 [Patescibacteria group bacterium]